MGLDVIEQPASSVECQEPLTPFDTENCVDFLELADRVGQTP